MTLMTKIFLALAAAASLVSLTACDNKDHTIVAGGRRRQTADVNAANVVLPPAITASKTYRCKDNSLVYIDWLSDGTARVKAAKTERRHPGQGRRSRLAAQGQRDRRHITYNGKTCHG